MSVLLSNYDTRKIAHDRSSFRVHVSILPTVVSPCSLARPVHRPDELATFSRTYAVPINDEKRTYSTKVHGLLNIMY